MREMLAELLLEVGQGAAALKEYETALRQTPNRYRALWGAARAADATGNGTQAAEYFGRLVHLAKNADVERQEVREARAFLARQQ
jgi:Tfp pilus assembly protein PilF